MGDPTADQSRTDVEVDEAHPTPGKLEDLAALGTKIAGGERNYQCNDHDRCGYQPEDPNSSH